VSRYDYDSFSLSGQAALDCERAPLDKALARLWTAGVRLPRDEREALLRAEAKAHGQEWHHYRRRYCVYGDWRERWTAVRFYDWGSVVRNFAAATAGQPAE